MNELSRPEPASRVQQYLRGAIEETFLPNYVYSYPSKRAYRRFDRAESVESIWASANGSVNLYIHIPFCSYHCHFCTLFLTTSHTPQKMDAYVASLRRQIAMYGSLIGGLEVVSIYFGGGTPTILGTKHLSDIFETIHSAFPRVAPAAEISVEGSPDTMTLEKLSHLKSLGVNRVSMGLQTLDAEELRKVGRPYTLETAYASVADIGRLNFDNVNLDLIYGLEGQTRESWFRSLDTTLGFGPTTVTLYPVVFRPLTVINKLKKKDDNLFAKDRSKYELYDESVEFLHGRGFHQDTFVRFTTLHHDGYQQEASDFHGVPLLGLGAGSRSYTDGVHYGTDFAVGRASTLEIIDGFISHPHSPSEPVDLGFRLDGDEQKRRFLILTLSLGRLNKAAYRSRFGSSPEDDFEVELAALRGEGCVQDDHDSVTLTRKGFKYSSLIASLFYSERVKALEGAFAPK